MSDSETSSTSATARTRADLLRFWLLIIVSSAWVYGVPVGAPGDPKPGRPETIRCPCSGCGKLATLLESGSYMCEDEHISRITDNGQAECVG
jgi:hypothetical protein